MSTPDRAAARIDELLGKTPVAFGLRAQGKFETVDLMLRDGRTWGEIGKRIGWEPETARRFYEMERAS